MSSTRTRRALGALLIVLAAAACGGTTATSTPSAEATAAPPNASVAAPSAAPDATASAAVPGASLATSGRIEVPDKGFAVTLPDGWTRIDLSAGDLEALMAAAGDLDPALAEQYSTQIQAMVSSGLAVFALGPDAASGSNLSILALPGGGLSLDLLEQINSVQLEQLAQGEIESERVTLPAGEAIHYTYQVSGVGGTSPTIEQYLVLAGDNQLVVSVTGGSAGDAEAIANSIELLD
jgi:hypothetical protein